MRSAWCFRSALLALSLGAAIAACGDDSQQPTARCGNGVVDPGEQCDDGNTSDADQCTNQCKFACGDGVVGPAEACDKAIPAGQSGACPADVAACDDSVACTKDTVEGIDCTRRCVHAQIMDFVDGDMCCPSRTDSTAFWDLDCPAVCGNGYVEMGETCDTGIAAGQPGACPTSCDDNQPCTDDTLVMPPAPAGACQVYCEHTVRTTVANGDGCCAPGATAATDNDCVSATYCGNGVFNPGQGETCDTAIAAGMAGACPTSCSSTDPCVTPLLLSAGTCKARCLNVPISYPRNGDNCCPNFYGANNRNDNDCTTSCGTPAEECNTPGVGTCDANCRTVRKGYRMVQITIIDPHIYYDGGTGVCVDLTGIANSSILPMAMKQDQDMDGWADLAVVVSFKPLNQTAASTPADIVSAKCPPSPNPATTNCIGDPTVPRIVSNANNMATGSCLALVPGSLNPDYGAPPTLPAAPCFTSDSFDADFHLGRVVVPLKGAHIAATYDADPAANLTSGLILGFVSEADAMAAIIPADVALIGGKSLYEILGGGIVPGSCTVSGLGTPIPDDRDLGPDGVTMGWWFYVGFRATLVPWDDRPFATQ